MTEFPPDTGLDRDIMGSPEAAKDALIEKAREWRRLRQPSMDTRAGHAKTENLEREARFQLANAALLWLWHEENPLPPGSAGDNPSMPVEGWSNPDDEEEL